MTVPSMLVHDQLLFNIICLITSSTSATSTAKVYSFIIQISGHILAVLNFNIHIFSLIRARDRSKIIVVYEKILMCYSFWEPLWKFTERNKKSSYRITSAKKVLEPFQLNFFDSLIMPKGTNKLKLKFVQTERCELAPKSKF